MVNPSAIIRSERLNCRVVLHGDASTMPGWTLGHTMAGRWGDGYSVVHVVAGGGAWLDHRCVRRALRGVSLPSVSDRGAELLHELAHVCAWRKCALGRAHGRVFVSELVRLYREYV